MSHPSDLPVRGIDPQRLADLRRQAASRLTGAAATKGRPTGQLDALAVLHALASSPETAPNALALLHEMQVLQVELDLQSQELQDSRAEIESALHRQTQRFDAMPIGCFTVDARGVMLELNQTGADMLGLGCADACGMPLEAFFVADGFRKLRAATAGADGGIWRTPCALTLRPKVGPERAVLASIGPDPASPDGCLVTLMPAESGQDLRAAVA